MTPESIKRMKRLMDGRDLLYSAVEQYETSIGALRGALDHATSAMTECCECCDEEASRQIIAMHKLVEKLPRMSLEPFAAIAETLEVLANEVTASEPHVLAGVS